MDDRELREQLLPKLVRLHDEPVDPNLIAAYVDGTLTPEEYAAVEERIASDPEALLLVRALEDDRRHARAAPWRLAALAAALLLAVGLWWAKTDDPDPASVDLGTRLAAATADLQREAPELFGDFEPLPHDALRTAPTVTRGGPSWVAPVGTLLEAPEALRWKNAPGSRQVRVAVQGAGTSWTREVEGEAIHAPDLAPGRYVVRLRAMDALAGQEVRRVFTIAGEDERRRHERALATIRAGEDVEVARLLAAHYAIRRALYAEARDLVRADAGEGELATALRALAVHLDAVVGPAR